MLKVEDAKVGMMVEIVGNGGCHSFNIGDIVEIVNIDFRDKDYECKDKNNEAWFCIEKDVKLKETKMIEEKDIERLEERDEALAMGFELILVRTNYEDKYKYKERVKIGNYFVCNGSTNTNFFLRGKNFSKELIASYETATWFDIQAPKMRQMNLAEIDAYLHEKGRSLCCRFSDGTFVFDHAIFRSDLESDYRHLGTLNKDNTFEPLPLIEDK